MTLSGDALNEILDEDVQELLRPNMTTVWLGPDRHCVFYPVRNRSQWNLVLMSVNVQDGELRDVTKLISWCTGDQTICQRTFERKPQRWKK
jgi:hypothetical protein